MTIIDSLRLSDNPYWATPQHVYDALNREFGFTLDVCADETNHKCPRYFDEATDGLAQDWRGEVCWMNPPYGRPIGEWTRKAAESARGGEAVVVGLLPNRTDTQWWRDVMRATEIRLVEGRLKFGNAGPAPFGSVIAVWGTPTVPRVTSVSFKEAERLAIESPLMKSDGDFRCASCFYYETRRGDVLDIVVPYCHRRDRQIGWNPLMYVCGDFGIRDDGPRAVQSKLSMFGGFR